MRTLAIVNMKGGVGKTTTAVHVAAGFAARGLRTLLVDADPQGNVGHVLGVTATATIREVLLGEVAAADAVVPDVRPGLSVIISTPAAFALDSVLAGTVQRETLMARRLQPLQGFDVLVIDSSPAMSLLTYNALLLAEELIVPVGMDAIPATLMWGVHDLVAPVRVADYVFTTALASRRAPSAFWLMPCGHHYVQHDQPADMARLIRATLARQASGAPPQQAPFNLTPDACGPVLVRTNP